MPLVGPTHRYAGVAPHLTPGPSPARRKKRQNAGRRFLRCEAQWRGGRRLVEAGWSNRRAGLARRRASSTDRPEARRACRGNPWRALCAQERTPHTSGDHRWKGCQRAEGPQARRFDERDGLECARCAELGAAKERTAPAGIPAGQAGVGASTGCQPAIARRATRHGAGARCIRRARGRRDGGSDGRRSPRAKARGWRVARLRAPALSPSCCTGTAAAATASCRRRRTWARGPRHRAAIASARGSARLRRLNEG